MNYGMSVDNKGNKQWVWLALDVVTREIIGVYIGARDEEGTQGLWNSLPPVYRQLICRGFLRNRCHANAQLLIPTFGLHMPQFYQARDIEPWANRLVKRAMSND